ncbi:phage gp6-like head-tail connector protein [Clostridium botulinum]|nr:phage gp6-like head-tail connector protein [Clostridium botulinum]NFG58405.1 phage gp6-like head-tail connector protein [Clostridium botulinum]NFG64883.1 phage gp6-like head-tail connector protein [Clostridium botulinum]NFI06042.1 phage gp6-like head-tail connector protein [Clostridium botulinum]NFJ49578.1 phage gp6-like head-tail connector protein [Clostridium botulinum]
MIGGVNVKVSEITTNELIRYCNAYDDEQTHKELELILIAVKAYIKNYTGVDEETLNEYEDVTLAVLVLVNEMYDNRSYSTNMTVNVLNPIVESILNMHRINLL